MTRAYLMSRATPITVRQSPPPNRIRLPSAPSGVPQNCRAIVSLTMATDRASEASVRAKSRPATRPMRKVAKCSGETVLMSMRMSSPGRGLCPSITASTELLSTSVSGRMAVSAADSTQDCALTVSSSVW